MEEEGKSLVKQMEAEADRIIENYINKNNSTGGTGEKPLCTVEDKSEWNDEEFNVPPTLDILEQEKVKYHYELMDEKDVETLKANEELIHEIAWLKYHPGYKTLGFENINGRKIEKVVTIQATFDGFITGENKVERGFLATWVRKWLSAIYYKIVTKMKGHWIHLPAGDARPKGDHPSQDLLSRVPVHYPQHELNLCLIKSFCSVLHYLEFDEEVRRLNNTMMDYMNLPLNEAIQQLKEYMRYNMSFLAPGEQFNFDRIYRKQRKKKKQQGMC